MEPTTTKTFSASAFNSPASQHIPEASLSCRALQMKMELEETTQPVPINQPKHVYDYLVAFQKQMGTDGGGSQSAEDISTHLPKLVRIFNNFAQENDSDRGSFQIYLMALNLISLLLFFKGKTHFETLPDNLKRTFALNVCNLEVQPLLKVNRRIEASLTYLLQVIKPYVDAKFYKKYVKTIVNLYKQASPTPKMNYNIIRIMLDLKQIPITIQCKYRLPQMLIEKTKNQSIEIQGLVYSMLLKMGKLSEAMDTLQYNLLSEEPNNQKAAENLERFMHAVSKNPSICTVELIQKIDSILLQRRIKPSMNYFKVLKMLIPKMDMETFTDLVQDDLLLIYDWKKVQQSHNQLNYFELYLEVLTKAQQTSYFDMLLEKLLSGGLRDSFMEGVRGCRCKALYFVLKELYSGYLKAYVEQRIN